MKHPLLECLGKAYPAYLEQHHDHILRKVECLWGQPEIDDYLNDLLIDKRGGRRGFTSPAIKDINALRDFRRLCTLNVAERRDAAVDALAQRGISVDQASFWRAMDQGHREVIDLFIRAGFDVCQRDEQGTPALLFALKRGYTIIARILLGAGVDVNERDTLGLAPLLVACGKSAVGYQDVAASLIRRGALLNVRDALGNTPLLLAITGGSVEIAGLLVDKGANVNVRTRQHETALTLAEAAGWHQLVKQLRSRGAHH